MPVLISHMSHPEHHEFKSWHRALLENQLTEDQLKVLDTMVQDGDAENREAAAKMLDWQDYVISPEEHMYGF